MHANAMRSWLKQRALIEHPRFWAEFLGGLNPRGPQWKEALSFWLVLLLLLGLDQSIAGLWVFKYAGFWSADTLAHIRPAEKADRTAVVAITAREREQLLTGSSPIPSLALRRAICAVLRVKPQVLGVDLDTSQTELDIPRTSTKIVWARGIRISRQFTPTGEQLSVSPDYLLGQSNPEALSGLAVTPVTLDWSVRTIVTCYEYDRGKVMQTLTAALAAAAGQQLPNCSGQEKNFDVGAYHINYQYHRFTLADFAPNTLDGAALDRCLRGEGEWSESAVPNHPLSNQVVLLGGEYDPQDWHPTPYGLKPGVEVQAGVVEHLLQGSAARDIERLAESVLKFVLALVIALIHFRFRPVAALVVSLGLGCLVLIIGLLAARFTFYQANTVPFLVCIILEQLVVSAEKAQKGHGHAVDDGATDGGTAVAGSAFGSPNS